MAADHLRYDWWGIQHIADFVRLMAVKQFPGAASAETAPLPLAEIRDSLQDVVAGQTEHELMRRGGAWLLDLDVIMFNQCRACPSRTGHIFSTLEQEPSWNNSPRKLKVHPVRGPNDHKWFMTPWYYPERSLVLDKILETVRSDHVGQQRRRYGWMMDLVLAVVHDFGLQLDMLDSWAFCPIPAGRRFHVFKPNSAEARQFKDMAEKSYGVAQFWVPFL